jgi:DNA-binding Lrp family transcriptional regulator
MDDTDRRLIALLRENARLPVASLAQLLKVSRGTVQNRIDRLTADGVIGGFTVRLKPEADPQRVRAITMVAVEPPCSNRCAASQKFKRCTPPTAAGTLWSNSAWKASRPSIRRCNESDSSRGFRIPRRVSCCRRTRFDRDGQMTQPDALAFFFFIEGKKSLAQVPKSRFH